MLYLTDGTWKAGQSCPTEYLIRKEEVKKTRTVERGKKWSKHNQQQQEKGVLITCLQMLNKVIHFR